VSVKAAIVVTLCRVDNFVLKMSTNHPNPSGLQGGSGSCSSSQGDYNGRGFPQPPDKEILTKDKNKNKNKNMSISSYFAIAPANKEVFSPSETSPANPVLATAVPATTTANADTSMTDDDDATIASSNASSFNAISSNHPKESIPTHFFQRPSQLCQICCSQV
jgi:hypothetical protein